MMMKSLVLLAALGGTVSAFTVSVSQSSGHQSVTTALNLTPNQGSQLVDAYNAAHTNKDDDDDFVAVGLHDSKQKPITTAAGAVSATARALLHRLVSLSSHDDHSDDDVVYYPVIGFTYVPDAKDHSRALPTVSNPSCRLVYEKLLDKQALYGEWKQPSSSSSSSVAEEQKQEETQYH